MGVLVSYDLQDSIAQISMDDGKANAMSPAMIAELNQALDQAEMDGAIVVLRGRDGIFSAGFDLKVLTAGGQPAADMLREGFELAERLLAFPRPVVIACTGHAMAMGLFLLLSGDYRVGPEGPYKFAANEVAIGLTMPRAAVAIMRQRMAPAAFERGLVLAEVFSDRDAVTAGLVDLLVPAPEVTGAALEAANSFRALDAKAHAATKLRGREAMLAALRQAIEADAAEVKVSLSAGLGQ